MEELKEEQNITDNENVPLVKKKRVINAPRVTRMHIFYRYSPNVASSSNIYT